MIYGDTDSLFVDAGEPTPPGPKRAPKPARDHRRPRGRAPRAEFGVQSWPELEFEKVYARFWMPEVRGGATGSKKRYAGLIADPGGERSSWSGWRRSGGTGARWRGASSGSSSSSSSTTSRSTTSSGPSPTSGRSLRRRAGLPKGDPEAARGLHEDDAAARQGRAQAGRRAGRIVAYVVTTAGPRPPARPPRRPTTTTTSPSSSGRSPDYLLHFVGAADFDTIADIRAPRDASSPSSARETSHEHAASAS